MSDPVANLSQLIWPALAVGYRYCAVVARMIRSSLLEVLNEDYIRTARAKGVYEKLVDLAPRAAQRAAARDHGDRPRIRLPDRRPRRDRAGVQPQRHRQAVRAERLAQRLHADPGHGDADRRASTSSINLVVDLLYAVFDPRIRYR